MKHTLKIGVSKTPTDNTIVRCSRITMREKLLRFFFGSRKRLTVIVPGDSVESLSINEISGKGGLKDEQN